jgi:tellurite resistance protein TerC
MNQIVSELSVAPQWLWIAFTVGVIALLFIDLGLFHGSDKKSSTKTALIESAAWISVAIAFNIWFGYEFGQDLGIEFLTGYLVEKSLSVDNLFVILLIFSSLKIPSQHQHQVLFWGILGAIVMRGALIIVGAQLLHSFHWILYLFGAILVGTAIKFLISTDEHLNPQENFFVRQVKKIIPISPALHGKHFFHREAGADGKLRLHATPLFLALIVIEVTDLVFAVDSIPAVFAVTRDAFVAFASNILALLGLRALYFVLADWVGKLRYLKPGLAAILGFIGTKMLLIDVIKIPSRVSLLVISAILTTAALSSWYVARIERLRAEKASLVNHDGPQDRNET